MSWSWVQKIVKITILKSNENIYVVPNICIDHFLCFGPDFAQPSNRHVKTSGLSPHWSHSPYHYGSGDKTHIFGFSIIQGWVIFRNLNRKNWWILSLNKKTYSILQDGLNAEQALGPQSSWVHLTSPSTQVHLLHCWAQEYEWTYKFPLYAHERRFRPTIRRSQRAPKRPAGHTQR